MNVTLTLDEALVREARHEAVDRRVSPSELVSVWLRRELSRRQVCAAARERALRVLEGGLDLGGSPLTRDEIYADRTGGGGES